jgi:hypothetical protein
LTERVSKNTVKLCRKSLFHELLLEILEQSFCVGSPTLLRDNDKKNFLFEYYIYCLGRPLLVHEKLQDEISLIFNIFDDSTVAKKEGNLVVGLGVCDGRPGHRVDLLFLVSHPLTSDVIFAVIPRQVVVKQGYRWVGVVLDPLQGGPEVGHEVRRGDVRRRRKTLEEEIVALLQPDVDGAHRLVGERSDSEFFARTIVNLEHLKVVKHSQLKNLLRLFEYSELSC